MTAVACFNDFHAAVCLTAAAELGLWAPSDLAAMGLDDDIFAPLTRPALTTIRVDAKGFARHLWDIARYRLGEAARARPVRSARPHRRTRQRDRAGLTEKDREEVMSNHVPASARRTGLVGVGLIGAGMISDTDLTNLAGFPDVRVHIVGDINPVRAQAQANAHHIESWGTPDDVLAHPDVELVVNLTIPAAHIAVATAAIGAGKHVWTEKPLGIDRESARTFLEEAGREGLLVGVAPDTAYGPGLQTARRVIERGDIGTPLSAQTVIKYPGPRMFHPNPEFLVAAGAGPLFDIGPYYLTALVHLFGPSFP